jgi:predicted O-methyltransferase YrrM
VSDDVNSFYWRNDFWGNADALVQYGLCRSRRPRRVIEVGCGWSSLLLARALEKNKAPYEVVQIEPYPRRTLLEALPDHWELHETILQKAPLELFDRLEQGDVLFYDGSHCSKVASDVNWFFFRILPRLKPGVLIHLHDISLPYEYPVPWIFERGQTWNEQYVFQAFMMHNSAYKILIANKYLWHHCGQLLDGFYKGVQPSYGASVWMEKVEM